VFGSICVREVNAIFDVFIPARGCGLEDGVSACGGAHLGVADSDGSGRDHHIMLPLNDTSSEGSGG
jgi:hypothetical protein